MAEENEPIENDTEEDAPPAPTPPVPPSQGDSATDSEPQDWTQQQGPVGSQTLDTSNSKKVYPKRHVTPSPTAVFEPQSGLDADEVAKQVNEGLWGSGQDRRTLLAQHGYDPNEIQRRSVALYNQRVYEEDAKQL